MLSDRAHSDLRKALQPTRQRTATGREGENFSRRAGRRGSTNHYRRHRQPRTQHASSHFGHGVASGTGPGRSPRSDRRPCPSLTRGPCWRHRIRQRISAASGSQSRTRRAMAFQRITANPRRMRGLPCVRGMRVTVSAVPRELAAGRTTDEVLGDCPYLDRRDVLGALEYAATPSVSASRRHQAQREAARRRGR
jgi:uncharacterized protein (DUF433 family)